MPTDTEALWSHFKAEHPEVDDSRLYEVFCFGDSEALANELAGLVLPGKKKATAGSVWALEAQGKAPPRPGDLSIVTSWAGEPMCIIKTQSVEIVKFSEVDAQFAAAEGEGDGSLEFWRAAHSAYFGRECARLGLEFSEEMPVVCERFEVVWSRQGTNAD
jgi:uncharacterized protein YhfF